MYLNYIVIGVSVIILSMNMDALMEQFGTDRTGFGLVVSGIGIGKFIVLFISGVLSDKFGRKPFILIGMVGFIVYFMGILLSPNVPIALFFAVLAGMCNSFIDAGTYPALMEIFPTSAGTANLAIKFFSAAGQFIMPFIFSFIIQKNLNYSLSFYIVIGYLVLNIVFMFTRGFPALSTQSGAAEKEVKRTFYEKPKMAIEGVCLILMGFTSTTIFTVVQVWMAKVAEEYAGMSVAAASKMLTYFSLGVVIGGGAVGLDVVEYYAERGAAKVSIVEMQRELGKDLDLITKLAMMEIVEKYKVNVYTSTKLTQVNKSDFLVEDENGCMINLNFDLGFICLGMRADAPLLPELQAYALAEDIPLVNIGDSKVARRIIEGTREARDILKTIELLEDKRIKQALLQQQPVTAVYQ